MGSKRFLQEFTTGTVLIVFLRSTYITCNGCACHTSLMLPLLNFYALACSDSWISSSVLPLVSGTSLATNSTVTKLAAENKKKVPTHRNETELEKEINGEPSSNNWNQPDRKKEVTNTA
jgi:hypothetical protein